MKRRAWPEHRVRKLRALPVGWAALIVVGIGVVYGVFVTITGKLDYGTAGFQAAVVLTGTMLGLALWDLAVGALAQLTVPALALPQRIALPIPRTAVPLISPLFFVIGILIGHQYWH